MAKNSKAGDRSIQQGILARQLRRPSQPLAGSATPDTGVAAATPPPKALMKTSALATGKAPSRAPAALPEHAQAARPAARKPAAASASSRQQKIEERVAAASEELASGITEASSAAEELRRAMEHIASGAEEAASASHETLSVAASASSALVQAREHADFTRRRTERLEGLLTETSNQIGGWATNISHNGTRQTGAVTIIEQLSAQAASIGDVTKTVGQVSDQTNLLALNAAIEAARAGDHGRGFAVVADEVRTLAETSEKSALDARRLAGQIQEQVTSIAGTIKAAADGAAAEADKSRSVILALGELRKEVRSLAESSQSIASVTVEAETAAREAQRGAEMISSAAEEQAAASAEALRSVEQQSAALEESHSAAQSVATLASHAMSNGGKGAHALATAAEQLSTAVQEISGGASQIMIAVEQISRGAQQQAAATQEASASMDQIEKIAQVAKQNSQSSLDRIQRMMGMLDEVRSTIEGLSAGMTRALESTRHSLTKIGALEGVSRSVEKIVDGISLVSIQTTMLAVNGSVEAARAGDYGKGFAVVSKDIRSMARDSGENASRIKDTVRAIQNRITAVRSELEQVISAAEAENQRSTAVLASLDLVETDMAEVAASNRQIQTSADSIFDSMKEAARGAQQVASVAEEARSAAAEAAAAAKQQARGAEDLAAAIEEIASLAEEIQRRDD